jgi:phytoene/squalene synthetase
MNATPFEANPSDSSVTRVKASMRYWLPFDNGFDPLEYSKGKSHFQFAFLFIPSRRRRHLLDQFYAFCRVADDLADETEHPLERRAALNQLLEWSREPKKMGHPFWDDFAQNLKIHSITPSLLEGIVMGVQKDLPGGPALQGFADWTAVEDYVQGVAVDVGRGVLQILGAPIPGLDAYALSMGRCVQYLNFCRDLDVDWSQERFYLPSEFLKQTSQDRGQTLSPNSKSQFRDIFWTRAMSEWKKTQAYSWKCLPAELMLRIYLEASLRWWRNGVDKKLSRFEKSFFTLKHCLRFVLEQLGLLRPWLKAS